MLNSMLGHLPQNQVAKSACRSSGFLPVYLKLMLSDLEIATHPSRTDASCVKTVDSSRSLITHDEGGGNPTEIDRDSRDSTADTHNGNLLLLFFLPYSNQ